MFASASYGIECHIKLNTSDKARSERLGRSLTLCDCLGDTERWDNPILDMFGSYQIWSLGVKLGKCPLIRSGLSEFTLRKVFH